MLQVGMYVRCPVEVENLEDSRTYFLGQIMQINRDEQTVEVCFHDPDRYRRLFPRLPSKIRLPARHVKPCSILAGVKVLLGKEQATLLCQARKPEKGGPAEYYVQRTGDNVVLKVAENEIVVPFTAADYNPVNQMLRYELHNPQWYLSRRIVSESLTTLNNSPKGFRSVLGTRVHLFPHQVDTIIRGLSEERCRLMLADEVGLGKTIEACAIMKGMYDQNRDLRALIVVPDTLIYQWQTELSYKFWFDVPIWNVDKEAKVNVPFLLISTYDLVRDSDTILQSPWDLCIVDETHRLLHDAALYDSVFKLSQTVENILLLSATPILHRETEYARLLTLLNPERFASMSTEDFARLLDKQREINDLVFDLMTDLPDYLEYDLADDFIDSLTEISEELNDEKLQAIIDGIDADSEDRGLSRVKLALAYIAEFYQIERNIIRHRRLELKELDIQRELIEVPYLMAGMDTGFYEEDCYDSVMSYADSVFLHSGDNPHSFEFATGLLAAFFSSPWALRRVLEERRSALRDNQKKAAYMLAEITGEAELLEQSLALCESWLRATEAELRQIRRHVAELSGRSKFSHIIDYLDQEDVQGNRKHLIFTGFAETAVQLEQYFKLFFGSGSVTSFHRLKSQKEMHEAADLFQNDPSCRFMICDESGGEGRNFQIADVIVHADLPWSPAQVEQRIGRLDRIGRDPAKAVVSVVFYAEDTVEYDLFRLMQEGLSIFTESLCGMEIVFDQLNETITEAFSGDVRFGLANAIPEIASFAETMTREVEKERYFDLARQLDSSLQDKVQKLISHFTANDGQRLMDTMLAWPKIAGFKGIYITRPFSDGSTVVAIDTTDFSLQSMENSLFYPPPMAQMVQRSRFKDTFRGTFSRQAAVSHEELTFFGPYNPFFDAITKNAVECYRGRCTAFEYRDVGIDWTGLICTWNIEYNLEPLIASGNSLHLADLVKRYLPEEQLLYAQPLNTKYAETPLSEVLEIIEQQRTKPVHLGKRSSSTDFVTGQQRISRLASFKEHYPTEFWRPLMKKVYKEGRDWAKKQSRELIAYDRALRDLEQIAAANRAREMFYGFLDRESLNEETVALLLQGLERPLIKLDSIAFVKLRS